MVIPPTPVCWRCGGPVFNHWLRGYICPYCRQLDATRKITEQAAKEQARQLKEQAKIAQQQTYYQEPVYYDSESVQQKHDDSVIGTVVASTVGCLIALAGVTTIIAVIVGIVMGIWQAIVYPVLHFISFGLI